MPPPEGNYRPGFGPITSARLPHRRTRHRLDGHEWTNFCEREPTPIQPDECFSDRPTGRIYENLLAGGLSLLQHVPSFHDAEPIDRGTVWVILCAPLCPPCLVVK